MVSVYQYGDITGLEALAGTDYSEVNDDYTDTVIESNISSAERKVNGKCNTSWSGTIPDGVVDAVYTITKQLMNNLMIENEEIKGTIDLDFFNESVLESLKGIINTDSDIENVWWE